MLKKMVFATALCAASFVTNAGIIEYKGYSRQTTSNIVQGSDLEWLMWDVTKGLSVKSALELYGSKGWGLATNAQMVSLFNTFQFGKSDWKNWESDSQGVVENSPSSEDVGKSKFLALFGTTIYQSCAFIGDTGCYSASDPFRYTSAFFGDDLNNNSLIKSAVVWEDSTFIYDLDYYSYKVGVAALNSDVYGYSERSDMRGVALVRSFGKEINLVSAPGSLALIMLTFLTFAGYRFKFTLRSLKQSNSKVIGE